MGVDGGLSGSVMGVFGGSMSWAGGGCRPGEGALKVGGVLWAGVVGGSSVWRSWCNVGSGEAVGGG